MLLAPHAPMAAGLLSTIEYASVAVVTLALAEGSIRAPSGAPASWSPAPRPSTGGRP